MPKATLNLTCPVIPILLTGMIHFVFSSMALIPNLLPIAYIFVHLVLVLIAIWSSKDKVSLEPVLTYIFVLVFSGIVDIVILGVYWEASFVGGSLNRFCAAMVIINLLIKPTTFLFSLFVLYTRNGGLDFMKFIKTLTTNEYSEIGGSVDVESNSGHS